MSTVAPSTGLTATTISWAFATAFALAGLLA